MASLTRFKADISKINDGTWVKLGEEYGNIEIKTRGFSDAYVDARGSRMRRASLRYGGDVQKIPQAEVRAVLTDLLQEYCLLDVRNLEDETGKPIPFELFIELMREDQYQDLYSASLVAADLVSRTREADLAVAKKNSPKPSEPA